jgi:phosphate starvation-inducible protein PhoH and related proteins
MAKRKPTAQSQRQTPQIRQSEESRPTNRLKLRIDDLKTFDPLTAKQSLFFQEFEDEQNIAMVLSGSAGTGKTFMALYKALELVMDPSTSYDGVIICRSAVASRDIGFLPGTEQEKMAVFKQVYVGICSQLFGRHDAYQRLEEQGVIDFVSTSFLRGLTLDRKIVILDEMQNCDFAELSTVITRVGYKTRIIVSGDYHQSDLKKHNEKDGILKFLQILKNVPGSETIEFGPEDIVRSNFVKAWIIAEEKYNSAH